MRFNKSVSVVIPCFNQGRYLHESISSALSNAPYIKEVIVINDGSTEEDTNKIIQELTVFYREKKLPVKFFRQENLGLPFARNLGIKKSTGKYIQLLDSDDVIAPDKFKLQLQNMKDDGSILISSYYTCGMDFSDLQRQDSIVRFDINLNSFLFGWERGFTVPIHTALFPSQILKDTLFDVDLRAKEDWAMWVSLCLKKHSFSYLDIPLAYYRISSHNMTRDIFLMGQYYTMAVRKIGKKLSEGVRKKFLQESSAWYEKNYKSNADPFYYEGLAVVNSSAVSLKYKNKWVINKNHAKDSKISILIPAFGHIDYLEYCIRSCCEQGAQFNVYLYDDASPNDELHFNLYSRLASIYPNFNYYISSKNFGISTAQNNLVNISSSEFVVFVDCDDIILPDSMAEIKNVLEKNKGVSYLFTDRYHIDSTGKVLERVRYGAGYSNISLKYKVEKDLPVAMIASHLKCLKRQEILECGGFESTHDGVQDWDMALRFLSRGLKFFYHSEAPYLHRIHTASVTTSNSTKMLRNSNSLISNFMNRKHHMKVEVSEIVDAYVQARDFSSFNNYKSSQAIPMVYGRGGISSFVNSAVLQDSVVVFDQRTSIDTVVEMSDSNPNILVILDNKFDTAIFAREYNGYFDVIVTNNAFFYLYVLATTKDYSKIKYYPDTIISDKYSIRNAVYGAIL